MQSLNDDSMAIILSSRFKIYSEGIFLQINSRFASIVKISVSVAKT